MTRKRWYPSAVLLGNGDAFVMGHTSKPPGDQAEWRDEYSATSQQFHVTGYKNASLLGGCVTETAVNLGDYPRLHLLRNRQLVHTNPITTQPVGPAPTRFLDIDFQQGWSCANPIDPAKRRWKEGATASAARFEGSSVQMITWHGSPGPQQSETDFKEVIYTIGGAKKQADGDDCLPVEPEDILATVEKMDDPDPSKLWIGVNPLQWARMNHHTVILPDGSLLVVGGYKDYAVACAPTYYAERYEPTNVFGGTTPAWVAMAAQEQKRGYHSVAGLLPDGSVFSAGGFDTNETPVEWTDSGHSVEIFKPPYFFKTVGRPSIILGSFDPTTTKHYGEVLTFDVQIPTGATFNRVALLRPAAVTHACDMSQRYVQLALFQEPQPVSPRRWTIRAFMPFDEFYAPPGCYMMAVTDSNQQPSEAVWIRLQSS